MKKGLYFQRSGWQCKLQLIGQAYNLWSVAWGSQWPTWDRAYLPPLQIRVSVPWITEAGGLAVTTVTESITWHGISWTNTDSKSKQAPGKDPDKLLWGKNTFLYFFLLQGSQTGCKKLPLWRWAGCQWQKVNRKTNLICTVDQMGLTDAGYTLFLSVHGIYTGTEHMPSHKASLSKFKQTEIMLCMKQKTNNSRNFRNIQTRVN